MADELRVLVVGAGRMGQRHLAALAAAPSASAAGIVEPVAEVRDRLSGGRLARYPDIDVALSAGGFDAAVIAAPSDLHLGIVRSLTRAGVPILCEKPCGLESAETREAAQVAAAAGVLLQVAYWRRFVPELVRLRERILAGELGELALVQAWQWDVELPPAAFRARSGGIVRDMGVHEFDQTRWLTSQELTIISATESTVVSGPPVPGDPESVVVCASLSGGGVATVSLGRGYRKGDCCWTEIMGTRDTTRAEFIIGEAGDQIFAQALVDQIEAFVDAVRGGDGGGADANDAIAALAAAERALELQSPAGAIG